MTREEMNFSRKQPIWKSCQNNQDVAYVDVPKIYQEYTTMHVLVMEYVDGCEISDKEYLTENGYDLKEIGSKLVDNYIKQVMDDGFPCGSSSGQCEIGMERSCGWTWDDGETD